MLDKGHLIEQPSQVPGYMHEATFFLAILQPSHFSRTGTAMCLPYPRYGARSRSPQAAGTNPCSPHIPEEESKAESGWVTCLEAPNRKVGGFVPGTKLSLHSASVCSQAKALDSGWVRGIWNKGQMRDRTVPARFWEQQYRKQSALKQQSLLSAYEPMCAAEFHRNDCPLETGREPLVSWSHWGETLGDSRSHSELLGVMLAGCALMFSYYKMIMPD